MITWLNAALREIDDDEGRRLLRVVRRGSGSVVTWRRAQMVLLSAHGMPVARRVWNVIHNFGSLYPKYKGGRPKTLTLPERREIKKIASPSRPSAVCRSRPGAWPSWPTSWSLRGWSTTSATRAYGSCSARRASRFNA